MEYAQENVAKLEAEIAEKIMGLRDVQYRSTPQVAAGVLCGYVGYIYNSEEEERAVCWYEIPQYLSDSNDWDSVKDVAAKYKVYFSEFIALIGNEHHYWVAVDTPSFYKAYTAYNTRQEARFHAMTEALPKILEIMEGIQLTKSPNFVT